jgi:hypothetical protein
LGWATFTLQAKKKCAQGTRAKGNATFVLIFSPPHKGGGITRSATFAFGLCNAKAKEARDPCLGWATFTLQAKKKCAQGTRAKGNATYARSAKAREAKGNLCPFARCAKARALRISKGGKSCCIKMIEITNLLVLSITFYIQAAR